MIRNWLRNFMIGRYGPDQLNVAIIVVALIFNVVYGITRLTPFLFVSYVILIWGIFRMFSRNIERRRRENDRFLRYWWPVRQRVRGCFSRLKERKNYRFFRCPGCHNTLRLPKDKGRIQITCPKCGERFIKKT